jgi:hypothetical protein
MDEMSLTELLSSTLESREKLNNQIRDNNQLTSKGILLLFRIPRRFVVLQLLSHYVIELRKMLMG